MLCSTRNFNKTLRAKFQKQFCSKNYSTQKEKGLPPYISNVNPTLVTSLSNGIKVAVQKTNSEIATVGIYLQAGSGYENPSNNGATHLFKELSFSDVKNPCISKFEALGAHVDANVDREISCFRSMGLAEDCYESIGLLGEMIQNKNFSPQSFEKARLNSLLLKEASEIDHEKQVFDYAHAAGFQSSSLGNTVLGTKEFLQGVTIKDLEKWSDQFVQSNCIVVAASGNIDEEKFFKAAQNSLGSIPSKYTIPDYQVFTETIGSEIRVRDDTIHDAYGIYGAESVGWTHPDFWAFEIIKSHIGSWDSQMGAGNSLNSRLALNSTDRNLAHVFRTFNKVYENTGLFGIYFVSDYTRADFFVATVSYEYYLVKSILSSEVERAKNICKSNYILKIQNSKNLVDDIATQVMYYGRHQTPAETLMRIDSVSTADVQRVGWTYLHDNDPILSFYGALKNVPDYGIFRIRATSV